MSSFKKKSLWAKIVYILLYPFRILFLGLIYLYKYLISPLLPPACRFTPTCSSYGLTAIKEYGPVKGSFLTIWRILRCNPWSKGGFDPVKPNIKGDIKWLI